MEVSKSGMSVLIAVILLGIGGLALILGAALLSLGEAERSFIADRGAETIFFADGCLDEALIRLRKNAQFVSSSLNIDEKLCTIVISGVGASRTVSVTSTQSGYVSVIEANVTLTGSDIALDTWEQKQPE